MNGLVSIGWDRRHGTDMRLRNCVWRNSLVLDISNTYRDRKEMYQLIQKSQSKESTALKRMGEIATRYKSEILLLLSNWLLDLKQDKADVDFLQRDWDGITKISFHQWVQLQKQAQDLGTELRAAQAAEQRADADYKSRAPLRFVSEWFAEASEKQRIQELQAIVATASQKREQVERKLNENIAQRKRIGRQFLRDSISSLDTVYATKTLGGRAREIMDKMARDLDAAWTAHVQAEKPAMSRLSFLVDDLRKSYDTQTIAIAGLSGRAPAK
jgi:hypothetical protein